MTKKSKSKYVTNVKTIKLDQHSVRNTPTTIPVNLQEQKENFLKHGQTPSFIHNTDTGHLQELTNTNKGQIRFEFLGEAEHILKMVKEKYGTGDNFLLKCYGERISVEQAQEVLTKYLEENLLNESLTVIWCKNLGCSAKMMWTGPTVKINKPEARKYTLWLNSSDENPYIRERGLESLLDHEIGTHFFRMFNDGLQPWYSDRKKFGLRGMGSFESLCYEEGLATIHSAFGSKFKYLWLSALVYYAACKSTEMSFKQLFDHLALFVTNREQRWKHVMRVKRGLADPNDLGGYGKDQCYFEGALKILRNIEDIDFHVLMSGKICADEINRVKRIARKDCMKLPVFMKNPEKYKRRLRQMAMLNGLHLEHPKREPSLAYLQRLQQRRNKVGVAGSTNMHKVRRKSRSHNASKSRVKKSPSSSSESSPSENSMLIDLTKNLSTDIVRLIPSTVFQPVVKDKKESISVSVPPLSFLKESSDIERTSPIEIESIASYKTTQKLNHLTISTDSIQSWRMKCARTSSAKSPKSAFRVRPMSSNLLISNNVSASETKLRSSPRPPAHEDKYFGCLNQNPLFPKEPLGGSSLSNSNSAIKNSEESKDDDVGKLTLTHLQQEIPLSMFGGVSPRQFFQQQLSKSNKLRS